MLLNHVAFYENTNQSRQMHLDIVKIWLILMTLMTKQYITFLNVYSAGQKPAIKSWILSQESNGKDSSRFNQLLIKLLLCSLLWWMCDQLRQKNWRNSCRNCMGKDFVTLWFSTTEFSKRCYAHFGKYQLSPEVSGKCIFMVIPSFQHNSTWHNTQTW